MIIVFDGHCLLCNGWVRFLLRRDRAARFRFASIQGREGQALLARAGLKPEGLDTLLLVDDSARDPAGNPAGDPAGDPAKSARSWQHTAAILRVLWALGWPWRLAALGWIVPPPLRDAAYRAIARNRYRLFGRTETCLLPDPAQRHRFLD